MKKAANKQSHFAQAQRPKGWEALIRMSRALGVVSGLMFMIASCPAMGQQLIVNPDFETNIPPNNGNNIGWPITPWILGSGNAPNVVKVDGPGGYDYGTRGPGSDASAPGTGIAQHYLDITDGANDFYQSFTVPLCSNGSATPNATYVTSGAFSTRDNIAGIGSIFIRSGVGLGGATVPGSLNAVTLAANTTTTGGWTVVGSTVALVTGQTYSFGVAMDNFVNFDNGTVTFLGLNESVRSFVYG
jgi:hypothetical protein